MQNGRKLLQKVLIGLIDGSRMIGWFMLDWKHYTG